MIKYCLHPSRIPSKADGQLHYIDAVTLARLYNVPMNECYIVYVNAPETWIAVKDKNLIHLYPKYDGDYKIYER